MIDDVYLFIMKVGMMKYKKFFEKSMWKKAHELQKETFLLVKNFPKDEMFGLSSQLNRSANSILANIAESDGRFHFADKIRVLYIARGEIQETQSHLIVASSRGYISCNEATAMINHYEQVKKELNGQIKDFSNKKETK